MFYKGQSAGPDYMCIFDKTLPFWTSKTSKLRNNVLLWYLTQNKIVAKQLVAQWICSSIKAHWFWNLVVRENLRDSRHPENQSMNIARRNLVLKEKSKQYWTIDTAIFIIRPVFLVFDLSSKGFTVSARHTHTKTLSVYALIGNIKKKK